MARRGTFADTIIDIPLRRQGQCAMDPGTQGRYAGGMVRVIDTLSIPPEELWFTTDPSQGPGGQHVNKASTRVTVHFDVAGSPSLTEAQKRRIMGRLRSRMTQGGVLRVAVQDTRSQRRNKELAVQRLAELLREALRVPKRRRPTRPTRASKERRLKSKQRRGAVKRSRAAPGGDAD